MEPQTAILIGAASATVGWLYTARKSRALSKKQHTINVILQANFNAEFLQARAKIAPHVKQCEFPKEVIAGQNEDLRTAFRDILNHYEFVSAGLRNGDFDEKLVKDSEKTTYITLYKCCEEYIWNLRDSRSRMTIYEHLEWIHDRWVENEPKWYQCFWEWLKGRPCYGKANGKR